MFAPISTETSAKQYVTFAVILCLQLGLLAAFRAQRFLPLYGSTAILHGYHTPRVVSKLYFHPPPPPEPAQVEVPVEAPPTPKPVAPKASPQATPEKPPEGPASSHSQLQQLRGAADVARSELGL
jgi:hypothetical protein